MNGWEAADNMKKIVWPVLTAVHFLAACGGSFFLFLQPVSSEIKILLWVSMWGLWAAGIGSYLYFRNQYVKYSRGVCHYAQEIMNGNPCAEVQNQETLTSKMVMELQKTGEILEYKARAAEKEKAETQQMVSDITHQLKTPITNIKMYGETLCEENLSKNEERQFIQIILQQVDKLEFLIESLAEMSRLESKMLHMHPENCKLIQTVSRALDTVRSRADEKKMELQVDVRPTIEVSHDSKWTAEALGNILDNAVKYTQSGGKITVSARNLEMYVVISISDNGIGIDPGHYNRIFQRFYREAKAAKTEGLGIGLYLARQIITLQGGYIKVRSKEGYGTEFEVFLPRRAA